MHTALPPCPLSDKPYSLCALLWAPIMHSTKGASVLPPSRTQNGQSVCRLLMAERTISSHGPPLHATDTSQINVALC